jgi:hypothetical protein
MPRKKEPADVRRSREAREARARKDREDTAIIRRLNDSPLPGAVCSVCHKPIALKDSKFDSSENPFHEACFVLKTESGKIQL